MEIWTLPCIIACTNSASSPGNAISMERLRSSDQIERSSLNDNWNENAPGGNSSISQNGFREMTPPLCSSEFTKSADRRTHRSRQCRKNTQLSKSRTNNGSGNKFKLFIARLGNGNRSESGLKRFSRILAMTEWTRAKRRQFCGRCHYWFNIGDPMLEIIIIGLKRRLKRCEACEGPAPADLAPYVPPDPIETVAASILKIETRTREWFPYRED